MAMDSDTLHTASAYLNNLLLARGLLRNGKSLDFAKPTRDTRAQIINIVHDLLLRRDRDQESRETVAATLRTLRAEHTRKDADLERLQARLAEKDRTLVQAQTETRNAKAEMRKMESSAKAMQDHVARLKAMVGQVKTQCTNDVRKRDLEIERLKAHLQGQQRGNKSSVVAPSIVITGGSGGVRPGGAFGASVRELQDPEYSLKQETNEFLTQLSQSLSDENDGLITLLRGALKTMKGLLGLPDDARRPHDSTVGSMESAQGLDCSTASDILPLTYEALASELNTTMITLKTLLTSPNFVSMDEVEVRDEEIARLRDGWERMESKWKDVLMMMDGWRRRMEKTGDTINLDDLKRGLGLGRGFESPSRVPTHVASRRETIGHVVHDAESDSGVDSPHDDDNDAMGEEQAGEAESASIEPPDFFNLRPARKERLQPRSLNIISPRKAAFAEDFPSDKEMSTVMAQPEEDGRLQTPTIVRSKQRGSEKGADKIEPDGTRSSKSSPKGRKRHSSPLPLETQPLPKYPAQEPDDAASSSFLEDDVAQMTVQDKLRAAQIEAETAAAKPASPVVGHERDDRLDLEMDDAIGQLRSPAKKSRIRGRPRKRKSTLSPEELESLLGLE